MTDTTTYRTRPTTVDDLPDYALQGHPVASITGADQFLRYPSMGQHFLAAIAEAERLGLTVTNDGQISVPLTEDEETECVVSAQRSWDYTRDNYIEALADPASLPNWRRSTVDQWAKGEGLDAIEWPAVEEVSA